MVDALGLEHLGIQLRAPELLHRDEVLDLHHIKGSGRHVPRLIPPFELSVGEHELHCVITAEGGVVFENTIRFLIE